MAAAEMSKRKAKAVRVEYSLILWRRRRWRSTPMAEVEVEVAHVVSNSCNLRLAELRNV